MSQKSHFTIGEIAALNDAPAWKVRRVVDGLDAEIPRAGLYRLVPRELLGAVAAKLELHGEEHADV